MTTLDEVIEELRRLDEPVPRPARLPTAEEVGEAEQRLGAPFHADLRRYLLEVSDVTYGSLEPVTIHGGHTEIGAVIEAARRVGVPDELVPICEDNGDYFCIRPDAAVVFWSHDGVTDESWLNLATWISEVWIGEG